MSDKMRAALEAITVRGPDENGSLRIRIKTPEGGAMLQVNKELQISQWLWLQWNEMRKDALAEAKDV